MPDAVPTPPPRDFIGYGATPPDPRWPGGARLALNFVFNYEEGGEPSVPDGEAATETGLTESTGQVRAGRDLAAEGMFEYGSRVGVWRLLRLFRERGLPFTVFGCALALERNPPVAAAFAEAGADICCHGWRWAKHFEMDEAEERAQIARAVRSIEATTGRRPEGWYCRYGPSLNTRRLLVEHGGFLYDSDSYADELPYWVEVQGRGHLVVPYSLVTNDAKYAGPTGSPEQWFGLLRDAFDLLYAEGATAPKMMSVGLHMRLAGHPARAVALRRFLDHALAHPGIWVTRRLDIARHWAATHPGPGHGPGR